MKNRELIRQAQLELQAAGVPDSGVDARELFLYASSMDRMTYLMRAEEEASEACRESYASCIRQRMDRIPLQQIMGRAYFMGLDFFVNEDVLCPRQDTELLVEEAQKRLEPGMRILDLCTGSGCVLISLMTMHTEVFGRGVDLSPRALAVARKNAAHHDCPAVFIESDLFESVSGSYDIITCNPPYIESAVIPTLMPEVRDHEPHTALDGGRDGLDFYRRVFDELGVCLAPGGTLLFEIGVTQRAAVEEMFLSHGFTGVECHRDYADNDRVVLGRRV